MKLSEIKNLGSFNKVESALMMENNLNISSQEDFARLFPDQMEIPDASVFLSTMRKLTNTDAFVEALSKVNKKETPICIMGDYDVDGVMATTILVYTLQLLGYNVHYSIPDRLYDGYGMQLDRVKRDLETFHTKLIITVDNGISAAEVYEYIKQNGCEMIVTDHHLPDETTTPNTLIIDPKFNNDEFSDICGAFVALKLAYALLEKEAPMFVSNINQIYPLAGIATITDMMPMLDENRTLVVLTLADIEAAKQNEQCFLNKMLKALNGSLYLSDTQAIANESLIGFYVGPSINAVSRIKGDVSDLVDVLIKCLNNPFGYFPDFSHFNKDRQRLSRQVFDDFVKDDTTEYSQVFVYDPKNYQCEIGGILGLIANKVSVKYNCVAVIGKDMGNNHIEMSGRSTGRYNLHDGIKRIIAAHPELKLSGGGHAQAMGIHMEIQSPNDLDNFKNYLNDDVQNFLEDIKPETIYEFEPLYKDEIIDTFLRYQPFGNGFEKLKFMYSGNLISYDNDSKFATIGRYRFKMFMPFYQAKAQIGSLMTVRFTVMTDQITPYFMVCTE